MTNTERAAKESWIQFGRNRVLVREVGSGDPVLLINGIGAHTRMWGLMERTLADRRVISFDAPGTGRSSVPVGPVSVERLAELAARVLDHAKVRQADALGYSMGGIVLQQLLADEPERVRRAVLVGTSPGIGAVYGPAMSLLNVSTPVRFLSDRLYARSVGKLVGGRARSDQEWVDDHLPIRLQHKPNLLGYSQQVLSLSRWSGLPLLPGISHPVLVLAGDDDPLTPVANAKLIAHLLAHARLRVLAGEGHLMPLDDRGAAPALIREFFSAEVAEKSAAWQDGEQVDASSVTAALAGHRFQLQPWPWAPVSAMKRKRAIRGRARPA